MSFLNLAVFGGVKNFAKDFYTEPSYAVIVPEGSEFSQTVALSLSENRKF